MSSYRVRQLRVEDADAVGQLFVDAYGEHRRMNGDEIRQWLGNEALDPGNLLTVVDAADRVCGYFDVWPEGGAGTIDVAAPGLWDEALGRAEAHTRALGQTKARVVIPEEHELERVVTARGYAPIRSSWTMVIRFGVESPREAVVPEGIEIRPYRHDEDERAVYEAMQEAFADHWEFHPQALEEWREFTVKARNFDPDLWLVAWDGADVSGASLNFPDKPDDPGHGWVGTLGVRRAWRGRGLGEALLRRSFSALHARGLREVQLGVDAENPTGATRLYERAGMSVLWQWRTWERPL